MNKNILYTLACVLIFSGCTKKTETKKNDKLVKLNIGWQIPWATQGQLVQAWKKTDILKKHNIEAKFIGRTYGPLLNELAIANEIDVVLTADQPAVVLFSKKKGWVAIGRLMYNRALTYVPIKSKINSLKELKGKTIGIPIGAAAERITVQALKKAGMNPAKDTKIINLGIREQGPLVHKGKDAATWDQFDALSGFDPIPSIFQAQKLIKVLDVGKIVSVVLMNKKFIEKNPGIAERVMLSLVDAYDFYRTNVEKSNEWFLAEAKLKDASGEACNIAAAIEPNLKVTKKSDIRVSFTDDDFKVIEQAAEFMAPKIKQKVNIKDFVSNQYVKSLKY